MHVYLHVKMDVCVHAVIYYVQILECPMCSLYLYIYIYIWMHKSLHIYIYLCMYTHK